MKSASISVAKYLTKSYIHIHQCTNKLLSYVPAHVQTLIWFDNNTSHTIFDILKPHFTWSSVWNTSKKSVTLFPNTGYYLWIFWNDRFHKREYICIRAELMKEVFHSCTDIKYITQYHDNAIIECLSNYAQKQYKQNHNKETFLEIKIGTMSILKMLHPFHTSLYISKNITGDVLIQLYSFLKYRKLNKEISIFEKNTPILVINDEFEEKLLLGDDFLFEK